MKKNKEKNEKKRKKISTNTYLVFGALIMVILYSFSFNKNLQNQKGRKPIKTALVNPKNRELVNLIEITQNQKTLVLEKSNEIWFVFEKNDLQENKKYIADSSRINKFLGELSKIRTMYKISDSIKNNTEYGFDDDKTVFVKYTVENQGFSEFTFGSHDFTGTSRAFMHGKSTSVYEIDSSIDSYLNTNLSFMCDPLIFPDSVFKNLDAKSVQSVKITNQNQILLLKNGEKDFFQKVSKILSLRHGGPIDFDYTDKIPISIVEIQNGDKTFINAEIFKNSAESYVLKTGTFINGEFFEWTVSISSWTYNTLINNDTKL